MVNKRGELDDFVQLSSFVSTVMFKRCAVAWERRYLAGTPQCVMPKFGTIGSLAY